MVVLPYQHRGFVANAALTEGSQREAGSDIRLATPERVPRPRSDIGVRISDDQITGPVSEAQD